MSILFIDGFEGQESTLLYDVASIASYQNTVTRFGGGYAIFMTNQTSELKKRFTAATDIYCGFAFRNTVSTGYLIFNTFGDAGATAHIGISVKADGAIEIRRGAVGATPAAAGTLLATSAAGVITLNTWNHFEVHVKVDDTVGVVEVRVNGSTSNIVAFSGDTKNAGTATTVDAVAWYNGANGNTTYVDDVYICNGLGSFNNTFIGDCRVATLVPTGAGASTALTPSTGANWQNVDEAPASVTDYNGSPTPGARDSYAITDLPGGTSAVKAVRESVAWHKSDAGAASMKPVLRVAGTNYYGATTLLSSGMTMLHEHYDTSPATAAAWTVAEVNAAEIGAEVV